MLQDAAPPVQVIALHRLTQIDARLAAERIPELSASTDANVRGSVVENLEAVANAEAATRLGRMLDDINMKVRCAAREALVRLAATPTLSAPVRAAAAASLNAPPAAWRGQEQAGYVLGALHETAAAPRLVELMDSPRAEVRIAAVVALRRLDLPETTTAIFDHAKALAARWSGVNPQDVPALDRRTGEKWDTELAQAVQALALRHYAPAEDLMLKAVPREGFGIEMRVASCWGLGKVLAGQPKAAAVGALAARASDNNMLVMESPEVRAASCVSLGRMKAQGQVGMLRAQVELGSVPLVVKGAARWALMDMSGKPEPPLPVPMMSLPSWFLEPLD
jgi:hypothetical protein